MEGLVGLTVGIELGTSEEMLEGADEGTLDGLTVGIELGTSEEI